MSPNFIRVVGGLFTDELLAELARAEIPKDKPYSARTFGHKTEDDLRAEAARVFDDLRARYSEIRDDLRAGRLENGELRKRWLLPLFRGLGFDPVYQRAHLKAGEQRFAISHLGWPGDGAPPLHLVAGSLDERPGRGQKSPHALVQAYLNHPDTPSWGVVASGRVIRLLGQNFQPRPAFLEVDLVGLFEAGRELALAEFRLFYKFFHQSRFPDRLTAYHRLAQAQGTRDAEGLRRGARAAVVALGNAFLTPDLKARIAQDERELEAYYQALLNLLYRLLFLLYAESRGLIPDPGAEYAAQYREGFSVLALRELSERHDLREDRAGDLFERLLVTFELVRRGDERLGVPALGGELFDPEKITLLTGGLRNPADRASAWEHLPHPKNSELLAALRHLTHTEVEGRQMRINYRDLGVEELGHIYEGLLGLVPRFDGERFSLTDDPTGRKASGSYYTPKALVGAVIEETLSPLIEERLKNASTPEEKAAAILSIRVVDPAMGSGAFLIGALERLAEALAEVWAESGRYAGVAEALPEARHRVAERCLYGVDLNPMAVELAKLSIWIASAARGRPLSFLDHHLKVGNSLVGAPPNFYTLGIPKSAYSKRGFKKADLEGLKLLTGKALTRWREEHAKNGALFDFVASLPRLPEAQETAADVEAAHQAYARWRESEPVRKWQRIADYWTAAWFAEPAPGRRLPDHKGLDWLVTQARGASLAQLEASSYLAPQTLAEIETKARRHRFFHWWLEFPEVFLDASGRLKENGGFDAVLGNPPWERVKLEDKQFFQGLAPEIAEASNKNVRKRKIEALRETNPELYRAYQEARADAEAVSNFLHTSGRYPLTGRGDVNTYSVFAEHARDLLGRGRSGMLIPTGIATDDTNKDFFAEVVQRGELAALLDFENREAIFPDVHRSYKFSIISLQKPGRPGKPARLLSFATRVEHLKDERRAFSLTPEEFALLNSNTRTCPTFRTKADAELTKAIYRRVPVLWREAREEAYVPEGMLLPDDRPLVPKTRTVPEENPWGVAFRQGLFNMTSDSHLFKTRPELEAEGFSLQGNRFVKGSEVYLPLYEAKMIWQFDHRFATYDPGASRTRDTRPEEHADPAYQPMPRYWVPRAEVEARLVRSGRETWRWGRGWNMGWRDISNATNERTFITSVYPRVGAGDTFLQMLPDKPVLAVVMLLGNLNSVVFDFSTRQKIGGTHLKYHVTKQLPVLPPSTYTERHLHFLVPRVLELVYTAWDLAPFALDVWRELEDPSVVPPEVGEAIRQEIARRFAEHHGVGLEEAQEDPRFAPPSWFEGAYPFPPFGWDEGRRARVRAELDAYYAKLYGLSRKQLRYILDPKDLTERELETLVENDWEEVKDPLDEAAYRERSEKSTFPSQTFSALKNKELREYGEYRTRRLVLEAWERLFGRN